jgi:competence protein ComGF
MRTQNNRGFTLVEMLFTFSIFLLILSSLPLIVTIVGGWKHEVTSSSWQEWELFVIQFRMEWLQCSHWTLGSNQITFELLGDKVTYETYGNMIRRRRNGQGHEIALQNVVRIQLMAIKNGFQWEVTFEDGTVQTAQFTHYLDITH